MTHIESFASSAAIVARHLGLKIAVAGLTVAALAFADQAQAQSLGYAAESSTSGVFSNAAPGQVAYSEDEELAPAHLRRTVVAYNTREAPGTIIIDTGNTYLYYVLGQGRAVRYGVGVGREGFTWAGVQSVTRKAEWPDWIPPAEMIARQPYLPRWVGGGPGNPLGARAMYLGSSVYRIHGTNDPTTIGKFVSSGCIRLTNEDVVDLFARVNVGTKVVVLPKTARQPGYAAISEPRASRPGDLQYQARASVNGGIY